MRRRRGEKRRYAARANPIIKARRDSWVRGELKAARSLLRKKPIYSVSLNGLDYRVYKQPASGIDHYEWIALDNGEIVAYGMTIKHISKVVVVGAAIDRQYRRKGIYGTALQILRRIVGVQVHSDAYRTRGAERVWEKLALQGKASFVPELDRWIMDNRGRR